jgi:hypothetical protein
VFSITKLVLSTLTFTIYLKVLASPQDHAPEEVDWCPHQLKWYSIEHSHFRCMTAAAIAASSGREMVLVILMSFGFT